MNTELEELNKIIFKYFSNNPVKFERDETGAEIKPDNLPKEVSDAWDRRKAINNEAEEFGVEY